MGATYLKNVSLTYKEIGTATKIRKQGNFSEFVRSCLNDVRIVGDYLKKCRENDLKFQEKLKSKKN